MENLSIVIKDSIQENIYNCIKLLTPLLDDGRTQLILINNIKNNFQIDYEYIIYEFEEDYEKFHEFCYASSFNDNIMIIEDSMVLTEELIRKIKELLLQHKNINIIVDVKKYYDEDNYYIEEKTLIFNNNKSSKEVKTNTEINNFTFSNNLGINLKHNISRFIQDEKFAELYLWYKNCIIKDEDAKFRFYNYIEKCKIDLEDNIGELIDRYFILEALDFKYCEYLKIMKMIKEDKLPTDCFKSVVQKNNFNERDIYFSYIIFECIKGKKLINEIFTIIDQTIIESYIKRIFAEYDYFYLNMFEFLNSIHIEKELTKKRNENVLMYMNLIEIYCENMSSDSAVMNKKRIMIQLFECYSKYGVYLLNNNFEIDDKKRTFLVQLKEASKLINLKRIKEAIIILREISEIYEPLTIATRYYLQKVMREYNSYKCKLSICIMAKNEEKFLDKCLKNIKPLIDIGIAELIFVDTGSTDRTIDIASKYTSDIYIKAWQGNFSEMRNYCISLAQGEYLFIPDADEELECNDIKKIIRLFSNEEYKKYYAYTFREKNYENSELNKHSMIVRMFIFKNEDTFYYYGKVHNQPNFKNPVKNLDIMIHHYGYIMNSKEARERKFDRTGYILKKELEKEPLNIYYRHQLTNSYSMYGNQKESLNQVKLFMKILNKENLDYKYVAYYSTTLVVFFANKLFDDTIKICDDILSLNDKFIDAVYFRAQSLFLKENFQECIEWNKKYLDLLNNINNNPIILDTRIQIYSIDGRDLAKNDIETSYLKIKDYSGFIKYIFSYKNKDDILVHISGIIKCYIELNKLKELVSFFNRYILKGTEKEHISYIYYIKDEIKNVCEEKIANLLSEFNDLNEESAYINSIKKSLKNKEANTIKDVIKFLSFNDIETLNIISMQRLLGNIALHLVDNKDENLNIDEIIVLRRITKYILIQTLNKKTFQGLIRNQILKIIFKYIDYSFLVYEKSKKNLTVKEILFLENINMSLKHMQKNDLISAVRAIKDAVLEDEEMANSMVLYIENLVESNENISINKEMKSYSLLIKNKINKLIEQKKYEDAKNLIEEYEIIEGNDLEIISMKSVIFIVDNKLDEAEITIKEGLKLDKNNFDLLYNLAYVYEVQEKYYEAIKCYNMSKENANSKETIVEIDKVINRIKIHVK